MLSARKRSARPIITDDRQSGPGQPPGRPQKRKEIQMSSDDMIRADLPLSPDEMHLEAVQRELAVYDPAAASALEKSEQYMARRVQLWRRWKAVQCSSTDGPSRL